MAAPHAFVSFTIIDGEGKTSVMHIKFPANAIQAVSFPGFAQTTATLLDAIITGKVIAAGIGAEVDLSGETIKANPLADSDVEEGARFMWNAASGAVTGFRVPTFDEAMLLSGTDQVDTADTDVDAFVQRIISGYTASLVNVSPSDDRGSDIESLRSARESFQSSRRT